MSPDTTLEILRSLGTVLAFGAFVAICLWAYSSKRRDDFEQAANLPFADEHIARKQTHRPDGSGLTHEEKNS